MVRGRPIRIVIADGVPIVRVGLRKIIGDCPDMQIVGEAASAGEALRECIEHSPDVVLLTATPTPYNALDIARALTGHFAQRRPGMLLLASSTDENSLEVVRAGATGLVLHHSDAEHLISALRMVAAGYWVVAEAGRAEDIRPQAALGASMDGVRAAEIDGVSRREIEVLRLLARGLSNAEIAAELTVGECTVKSHIQHLLQKLGLRNRVHAVIYAYEAGVIQISEQPARMLSML